MGTPSSLLPNPIQVIVNKLGIWRGGLLGKTLFTAGFGGACRPLNQQPNIAQELCEWLGFLPLGLELVGQYLVQQPDLPLTEMLQRLKAQRLTHNALLNIDDSTLTAQRGVSAAFELSWESLDEKAQELSCLLSLFASAPIPWFLVAAIVETEEELRELEETRAILVRSHLLQRTGEETYQLLTTHYKNEYFGWYRLTYFEVKSKLYKLRKPNRATKRCC